MAYCAAFGCSNCRNKKGCLQKSFFRFPLHNKLQLKVWLLKIRRAGFVPSKNSVLCSDHFEEECFKYQNFTNLRLLKLGAVPTKFTFTEKETRIDPLKNKALDVNSNALKSGESFSEERPPCKRPKRDPDSPNPEEAKSRTTKRTVKKILTKAMHPQELSSVTVSGLQELNFSRLSLREKVAVKKRGRATPDIIISQPGVSNNKKYIRSFNSEWYHRKSWLCGCEVRNALFCFPCLLYGGDATWTKDGCRNMNKMKEKTEKHEKSKKHLDNVVSLSLLGNKKIKTQDVKFESQSPSTSQNEEPIPKLLTVASESETDPTAFVTPDVAEELSESDPSCQNDSDNFEVDMDIKIKKEPPDFSEDDSNNVSTELTATINGESLFQPIGLLKEEPITIEEEPMTIQEEFY